MELRIYAQMLQRNWWIVTLSALSALAIAIISSLIITPIYKSSARFIVTPNLSQIDVANLVPSLDTLDKRSIILTYGEILNSDLMYQNAVKSIGLDPSDEKLLAYTRSTVALSDANILVQTIQGPDPNLVATLANSIGLNSIDYIKQLISVYELKFLDPATVATTPIRPLPIRDASLALGLGLIFGTCFAIFREFLRTPIESLLQRSVIDNNSQAYNRDYLLQRMEETVALSDTAGMSLGLVRLDGFKTFIELMPHSISQHVIRQVVQTMKNELKGNDLVGRWNENTIAILLPNTPGTGAVNVLGRVQLSLSKPIKFSADGETLHLYPKIGIVERQPGASTSSIIEQADRALTQATHGKSGLVLFRNREIAGIH
jgi:diguanylate cyclase (GGDEF)-like protein